MDDNIQTDTTGRLTPCLQNKIDKTAYLVEMAALELFTILRSFPLPYFSVTPSGNAVI